MHKEAPALHYWHRIYLLVKSRYYAHLYYAVSHSCYLFFFSVDRSWKEEDKEAHQYNQDHSRGGTYQPEDCQVAVRVREATRIQDGSLGRY